MSFSQSVVVPVFQRYHQVILGENHFMQNAVKMLTNDKGYLDWLLAQPINIFHEGLPTLQDHRHYEQTDLILLKEQDKIDDLLYKNLFMLNSYPEINLYGLICPYFDPFSHYKNDEAIRFIRDHGLIDRNQFDQLLLHCQGYTHSSKEETIAINFMTLLMASNLQKRNGYLTENITAVQQFSSYRSIAIVGNAHVDMMHDGANDILGIKPLLAQHGFTNVCSVMLDSGSNTELLFPRVTKTDNENPKHVFTADYMIKVQRPAPKYIRNVEPTSNSHCLIL